MDCKQVFDKYYSKLATEGIIKSILCALAIGLGAAFVVSFVFWVTDFKYFWISIIIGAAVIAAVTPAFYFRLFRPTAKSVAHRVDKLGLEERIITMTELENDQSYIAMRQREDAQAALVAARDRKIKLKISARMIIAASVVAAAFFVMLLINIFSSNGVIPKASEIFEDQTEEKLYTVSYLVEGEGNIVGEADQIVMEGDSTTLVVAVAEDGWCFVMWSDENTSAERYEFNVIDDLEITAIFEEVDENNGQPGNGGENNDGEPSEGEEGDPGAPGGNGEGEPGEGEPSQSGGQQSSGNPGEQGNNGDGSGAGGGNDVQNDTFIDGNTPLQDYYQEYYEQAMKLLAEGKELPEDLRKIIEGYYEGIKP